MKALISKNEFVERYDIKTGELIFRGNRVCETQEKEFPVSPELFWIDCDHTIASDTHYFDGQNIILKPQEEGLYEEAEN